MTGPTGADQQRPGDMSEVDLERARAELLERIVRQPPDIAGMAAEIRHQTAMRRGADAHRTTRRGGDHPDSPSER